MLTKLMKDLLKAQLTIGLLAYFATAWGIVTNKQYANYVEATPWLVLQFVVMIILAYVILLILQWVRIFDLKTNALLTLIVLVSIVLASSSTIF